MLDAEYTDLVDTVEQAVDATPEDQDPLVVATQAYVRWGLAHPGAYQLLFESGDDLPETRAPNGPRLQNRITELVAVAHPDTAFESALLLWSAYHGLVSLRLHKSDWEWGITSDEAAERLVRSLVPR